MGYGSKQLPRWRRKRLGHSKISVSALLGRYATSSSGSTYPPADVLYLLLYPYITGQLDPDGSSTSNLYVQLLPYITGQLDPDGSTISNLYLQLLPYING